MSIAAETVTQKKRTKGLERIFKSVRDENWVFAEASDSAEIERLIQLRGQIYQKGQVAEYKPDKAKGMDPFDIGARFFVVVSSRGISEVLRAVERSTHEILPTELSLDKMDDIGRNNLRRLLERYSHSKKVYEIGGLYGKGCRTVNCPRFVLGISEVANIEQWDLVIQTHHPRHTRAYLSTGLPYQKTAGFTQIYTDKHGIERTGYTDHCKRPAVTLALEGQEFREAHKRILGELGIKIQVRKSAA